MSELKKLEQKEKRDYKVYVHINKLNNKRYIGITKQSVERRWSNGKHYSSSPYFYNAIKKYGWSNFDHIVLYNKLSETEAKQFEVDLISHYRSNNRILGYNCTNGGDGASGRVLTDEQKDKIRQKIVGRKLSREHKLHIKEALIGRRFSNEWKQKISESHFGGKNPMAREIVQIDTNYKLIKKFNCARDAERELGVHTSHILDVCHGRYTNTGGLIFRFAEDYFKNIVTYKKQTIVLRPYRKTVAQCTLDGKVISVYKSIYEASKKTGVDKKGISNSCNGKLKTSGGYTWKLVDY